MALLIVSFIAGVLTVLAPCILPFLPVVIGSSVSGRSSRSPYIIVASLAVSVILFTYLLKVSTVFIDIQPEVWSYISGGILLLFGLTFVFPAIWEHVPGMAGASAKFNSWMGIGQQKGGVLGDVIIGAALGPVFSTCSPTYFVILASVLPASFALGSFYILVYVLGLSLVLLLIALLGQRFADKLSGVANSRGAFKRTVGVIFVILGAMIILGYEKQFEAWLIDHVFDITSLEQKLLQKVE